MRKTECRCVATNPPLAKMLMGRVVDRSGSTSRGRVVANGFPLGPRHSEEDKRAKGTYGCSSPRGPLPSRREMADVCVVVAYRVGVICRSCRRRIEIEDEYIRGVRASEMAAALYKPFGTRFPDFVNVAWQETLTYGIRIAGNAPVRGEDLLLYDG
jgi:hypothetical protein